MIAPRFSSTSPSSEKLLSIRATAPRARADVLGNLLMGHAYGIGAGTLRFGQEKICQPPIQTLEHDLLHRPHHIRKSFRCQLIEEAADMKILLLEHSDDICRG